MDEAAKSDTDDSELTPESAASADGSPIADNGDVPFAEAASMLAEIREQHSSVAAKSHDIEQGRLHAKRSRSEIDARLAEANEALTELRQHAESGKAIAAELVALHNGAQTTHDHAIEVKAKTDATMESMHAQLATATENANHVAGVRATAEQSQEVVAIKSQHIEEARLHADKVRAALDRFATQAEQSAGEAEKQHQASRTTHTHLNELFTAVQASKATADSEVAEVARLRQQSEVHAETSKKIADIAAVTEERIAAYEARLAEFEESAATMRSTIESLLPGAASAGLASAFNKRREHFKWPQRVWQWVFLASILALLGLAGFEFKLFSQTDVSSLTWDKLGLSLLHRLPFAVPLIWLAFHASHKAALAQRVEEDYAFKETVSRSFEGYRREMAELEGKAAPESALSRLCEGVLAIITNPPGRIYEKHHLNATPLNAASESLVPLLKEAAKASKITIGLEKPPGVE